MRGIEETEINILPAHKGNCPGEAADVAKVKKNNNQKKQQE